MNAIIKIVFVAMQLASRVSVQQTKLSNNIQTQIKVASHRPRQAWKALRDASPTQQ